ncbi:alpha/beta hydrolase [Sinorhizobium meliloti WSM1022]|jgi:acetyl esterase|uniref:alpha/beta hydrolase n=1 Tax=Rhizobium meliloti TaxID=382 RepID=UPI0003FCCE30|nr:alpha/beta hydrolase [Sinorhizobium meliloti]ASQ05213.1 esterase [Sinorhizobium meliloti]MCO6423299.1 alpha/beta hydrolase [Sinorhizobium meliloti]MDW9407847.1 alpha/beta hydrolase fold domain-containing protein [Sinorhizobium meliloti]MDW9439877.1 alpha/beta hydrolase fold domain-containing protein [Sinorhizobium meliloti]MDW9456552.1 alpha/beta hydrolase fold domain-containing protein [Sinorhizobium meliloti]
MNAQFTEETMQTSKGSCRARVYRGASLLAPPPIVLHLHGGGFVGDSVAAGEKVANALAAAGAVVISPEYPSACMNPFPAALDCAYAMLSSMRSRCPQFAHKKSMLFVAGEEAGGNLAAGLALMARDQFLTDLKGQILLSPLLDPCLATASFRKFCPQSSVQSIAEGWQQYLGERSGLTHPYAAPGHCSRLGGLVPALVVTSEECPMRDEAEAYAERLREAGVPVETHVLPGRASWLPVGGAAQETWPSHEEIISGIFSRFFKQAGAKPAKE